MARFRRNIIVSQSFILSLSLSHIQKTDSVNFSEHIEKLVNMSNAASSTSELPLNVDSFIRQQILHGNLMNAYMDNVSQLFSELDIHLEVPDVRLSDKTCTVK